MSRRRENFHPVDELMGAYDWQPRKALVGATDAGDGRTLEQLQNAVDLHPAVINLLWDRGLRTPDAVNAFLNPSLDDLSEPYRLKGMEEAVSAVFAARDAGERVLVFGDYDVDGVSSTALLVRALTRLGVDVEYAIPDRLVEGYGLNEDAVRAAAGSGCSLLITVDNGISAVAEVRLARDLGLTIVVTDHHQPPDELPPAHAVINPLQPGCQAPFRHWAGVGVTFKLVQALFAAEGAPEQALAWLDLVALGTVADVVPLTGENRILVAHGLRQIKREPVPGIAALQKVAGVKADELTVRRIAFTLAPRLNAAGRLGDAGPAVELLLTSDEERALRLAEELDDENRRRQAIGEGILQEVQAELDRHPEWMERPMLILAREGWHTGLVGIVASRMVDRFGRPAILMDVEDGVARGSARSIEGFNLYAALRAVDDLLEAYGGHEAAAGLSLPSDRLPQLRQRLWQYAAQHLPDEPGRPTLAIDAVLTPPAIEDRLVKDIQRLAPFGFGNPRPVFRSQLRLNEARQVGSSGSHLKMTLNGGGSHLDAIAFRLGSRAPDLEPGQPLEVAFTPEFNTWRGKTQVQLNVQDLRLPPQALRRHLISRLRGNVEVLRRRHPDRTRLAALYKALQQVSDEQPLLSATEEVCRLLRQRLRLRLPRTTLEAALTIFAEIGLMSTLQQGGSTLYLFNADPQGEMSLENSPRYRRGRRELEAAEALLKQAEALAPERLAAETAALGRSVQEAEETA